MITNIILERFVRKLKYYFVLILLVSVTNSVNAQFSTNKRADKLFIQSKYEQALNIYLNIYQVKKTDQDSLVIIDKIARCFRLSRNNENALIWYKKLVNTQGHSQIAYFHYAELLNSFGHNDKAEKWFLKYSSEILENKKLKSLLLSNNTVKEELDFTSSLDIKSLNVKSGYLETQPIFINGKLVGTDANLHNNNKNDVSNTTQNNSNNINSLYHEIPLSFSADKKTVYFTKKNLNAFNSKITRDFKYEIFQAECGSNGKANIKKIISNSGSYSVSQPAISKDGSIIVFSSNMPGGYGAADLYFSFLSESGWSEPINLGGKINSSGYELFPFFSSEDILYFSSDGHRGMGGMDIYMTWPSFYNTKKIKNLGKSINTTYDDFGFVIQPNKNGYFISNRPSSKSDMDNIYNFSSYSSSKTVNDTLIISVDVVLNEKVQINVLENDILNVTSKQNRHIQLLSHGNFKSEYKIESNGDFTYWVNKYFTGTKKVDYLISDEWGFTDTASIILVMQGNMPPKAQSDIFYTTKNSEAKVIDIIRNDSDPDNNLLLDSVKIIKYPQYGGTVISERRYFYYQPPTNFIGKDYCVYQITDSRGGTDTDTIFIEVFPKFSDKSIASNGNIDLSILFESNKWKIDYRERKKLDMVVEFMLSNPSVKSQITGHTDPTASSNYNNFLSLKRAVATVNYLNYKGVKEYRLTPKGKGENELVYRSSNGDGYGDEKNYLNRRATIKVTEF